MKFSRTDILLLQMDLRMMYSIETTEQSETFNKFFEALKLKNKSFETHEDLSAFVHDKFEETFINLKKFKALCKKNEKGKGYIYNDDVKYSINTSDSADLMEIFDQTGHKG